MRVLKFRMWDGEKLTYMNEGETLDSFFLHANIKESIFDKTVIFEQFTGLTDKNGKEIFEGDRVTYPNPKCNGIVMFGEYECGHYDTCQKGCGFYLKSKEEASSGFFESKQVEIIGTIHDNEISK